MPFLRNVILLPSSRNNKLVWWFLVLLGIVWKENSYMNVFKKNT
jgi:hypothetical protein